MTAHTLSDSTTVITFIEQRSTLQLIECSHTHIQHTNTHTNKSEFWSLSYCLTETTEICSVAHDHQIAYGVFLAINGPRLKVKPAKSITTTKKRRWGFVDSRVGYADRFRFIVRQRDFYNTHKYCLYLSCPDSKRLVLTEMPWVWILTRALNTYIMSFSSECVCMCVLDRMHSCVSLWYTSSDVVIVSNPMRSNCVMAHSTGLAIFSFDSLCTA